MPSAFVTMQHWLPQALISRVVYHAARTEAAWLKTPLTRWFANHYNVDLGEAEHTDLAAYPSFNAFFTRALKPGARPVAAGDGVVVSPVDGTLTEHGRAAAGRLVQAKGFDYSIDALLGRGPFEAAAFEDGGFATIYLAPYDYHRIHMPVAGKLVATRYVPGKRFSVNAATACGIRNLFCRNERVVCWFETPAGPLALVMVGALNVSSISTATRGEIPSGTPQYWEEAAIHFAKGDELGRFNLGSTVVLVFARGAVDWAADLKAGRKLKLGEAIGQAAASAPPAVP